MRSKLASSPVFRDVDRALRFGVFDPLLNTARFAGLTRWGPGLNALVHAAALRWPDRAAIIDDHGTMSYRSLDRQADALSRVLRNDATTPVGVLCRNHRGFPLAWLGTERAGRDLVLLNTALPGSRLAEIVKREGVGRIIADAEFAELLDDAGLGELMLDADALGDTLASARRLHHVRPPKRRSKMIMLTSGTTGPPKGARRPNRNPSFRDAGLLDAIPYRLNEVALVCSPLFHAWGLSQSSMAFATGSTLVLHRRFDPVTASQALIEHDVTILAVVPLMLRRILDEAPGGVRLPKLRLVLSSGNVLGAELAKRWIGRYGPNLYNMYGSTETAIASIAGPKDLIDAPGTVGRAPRGVTVAILGDDDRPVPTGQLGRVFTANSMQFEGYTDGSDRTRRGALMATGDLGYTDAKGRLFVDGRENDLIVTGGENVFPSQIEEVVAAHPAVLQAAVVGLPDDTYGQRVACFVVPGPGFDAAELTKWLEPRLASFKRPREIRVVEALPMTTTGKVIRHALATLGLPEHV